MSGVFRRLKGALRTRATSGTEADYPVRLPPGGASRIVLSSRHIAESASIGDVIGILYMAAAPDGITWTFTIESGGDPDGKFQIANDNELQVGDSLNYEVATSHSVTITATPSEGEPVARAIVILIDNVIETPVNFIAPSIVGVPEIGEVIQCLPGSWRDMGVGSDGVFTYQWKDAADDSEIEGETTAYFNVTAEWLDESVYCTVTATNSADSAAEDSNTIGPFEWPEGQGAEDGFLLFDKGAVTGLHLGWI